MSSLSQPRSLANCLLCAVPQLMDANFHRSVVLILAHGAEGALGLVINRALPVTVQDLAQELDLRWTGHEESAVRHGGPVSPERGWILHDQPHWDPSAESIVEQELWLTTSLEHIKSEPTQLSGEQMRMIFALGYAGWEAGQLETELAAGSWVAVPLANAQGGELGVDVDWLFDTPAEVMWHQALAAIGINPLQLVGMHASGELLQ